MKSYLLIFLMMLLPTMATAQDFNPDSLYKDYITKDVRKQLDKFKQLEIQLQQQEQERERKKMVWYLVLAGCAVSSLIVTGGIFSAVFKGQEGAPLRNKISAGAICLCGGLAIFLLDVVWFYMSFEANQKLQKLFLFALLLILGIALWIYTKNLNKRNTDDA
ncbi:MAG: hypothetical protein IKO28_00570 [Prevotella sp.]|nr:hypothetical protein [Prevotella sp.]